MNSRPAALDGRQAAQWGRARARAARAHHPDLGGNVDTYLEALHQVDARYGVGASGTVRVQIHRSRAPWARVRRATRAARNMTRELSTHLPPRFRPGPSYIDL